MTSTGSDDIAVVLRSSATNEMSSNLLRDSVRLVADGPGIARADDGPLASAELFVIIDLPKRSTGTPANVPFRGVEKAAQRIRGDIEIVPGCGRWFEPGRNELIMGQGAARSFRGLEVGNTIQIGRNEWHIVGMFRGGVAESELGRTSASATRVRARRQLPGRLCPAQFAERVRAVEGRPTTIRDSGTVLRQRELLIDQAKMLTDFVEMIGVSIAVLMSLGALLGALNTMFRRGGRTHARDRPLRALGFGAGAVVLSILLESVALALAGGGAAPWPPARFSTATRPPRSTSILQQCFRVAVTPSCC
jgi:putative ABC transport system permease protein